MSRIRLVHVLPHARSLGGTERTVLDLIGSEALRHVDQRVAFVQPGPVQGFDPARTLGGRAPRPLSSLGAIARFRPDIVHGWLLQGNALGVLAKAVAPRTALVTSERNAGHAMTPAKRRLERVVARFEDVATANSAAVERAAVARVPRRSARIRVIAPGVAPVPRPSEVVHADAVAVGRLHWVKDHETALRAWSAVVERRPDATLSLVGDGPERERLEALAATLGLRDRVVFHGETDPAPHLHGARVFVLSSRAEGFSRALIEALGAGVPAVCTDVGGADELAGAGRPAGPGRRPPRAGGRDRRAAGGRAAARAGIGGRPGRGRPVPPGGLPCRVRRPLRRAGALMCGIAGMLACSGPGDALEADVRQMTDRLVHRGPDDEGLASGPGWAVGMRRLAIQDTSHAGHQPMRLGDLTLVFNGEVYNFHELRRELEAAGYAFRSGSDTEVVLAAPATGGAATRSTASTACSRSCWSTSAAAVRWSRATASARSRCSSARLRRRGRLRQRAEGDPRRGARRAGRRRGLAGRVLPAPVRAGAALDLPRGREGAARERAGDRPRHGRGGLAAGASGRSPTAGSEDAASPEEVLAAVREAVRRRLVADVPVGAFLSGGTDSSLVVACMRELDADARTFSIGFADPRYDESRYADAVAQSSRDASHAPAARVERRDGADALVRGCLRRAVRRLARRSRRWRVSALARQAGDVVALSGDGGDELFGGYTRYRAQRAFPLAARPAGGRRRPAVAHPARRPGAPPRAAAGGDRAGHRRARALPGAGVGVAQPRAGRADARRRGRATRSAPAIEDLAPHGVERMMRCDAAPT